MKVVWFSFTFIFSLNCYYFTRGNKQGNLINAALFVVSLLLRVAYLTLLERSVLGFSQNRLSPNKTLFKGLFQPLIDGLKLVRRELILVSQGNTLKIITLSRVGLFFMLLNFQTLPVKEAEVHWNFKILILLLLFGLNIYVFISLSFLSASKYSTLGAIRAASQSVSFDIRALLIFMLLIKNQKTLETTPILNTVFNLLGFTLLVTLCLIEVGRSPFDLPEGESELVSGFNTELSSVFFVFVFLTEYGNMLFLSWLRNGLILNQRFEGTVLFLITFLYARSVLPRVRLDKVTGLSFKHLVLVLRVALIRTWCLRN